MISLPPESLENGQSKDTRIDLNNFEQMPDGSVRLPDNPETILKKYEYLLITSTTLIPEPSPVLRIYGEMISTQGNITTISGASKSGKSAFTSVILGGSITKGQYDGFTDVEVMLNHSYKAVLHFDTEQARHKHQNNLKAILRRANLDTCPDFLLSYNIRQLNVDEYQQVTSEIVDAAYRKHNGIHLIVIDGIADYIRDVNDPEQSNGIVDFLEKLSVNYDCPIITIVHTNPNSDKERGHLGSQLQRKSESVLMIRTEKDISTLEPKFLRNAGKGKIPLVQFKYDPEKGYHVYWGIRTPGEAEKDAQRIENIHEIAKQVFVQTTYSYDDAVDAIMRNTNKKERTVKDLFKTMKAHSMIQKGEDNLWRLKPIT